MMRLPPPSVRTLARLLLLPALVSLATACGDAADRDRATVDPSRVGERLEEIFAEPDPIARIAELAPIFLDLPPEALPAVLEVYERSGLDGGDPELVLLGLWWARFDPRAAEQWTRTDWRAEYGAVLQAVYRSWAHSDPEAAFASAAGQLRPAVRDVSLDAAIAGWDESGKPGLIERVRSLPGLEKQRIGELLARRRVVSHGAEAALAWAEQLKPRSFANIMALRVASAAAQADPEIAARWAEPRIAAAKRPTGLPRRIGTRWVRYAPEDAMAWLESLPAGKDREDGVTEAYRDWIKRDPEAAITWLEAQEMEPWNEAAFYIYMRGMASEKPAEMLALSERITDASLKEPAQIIVLRIWLGNDPEAAEAWIEQSSMPEGWVARARMVRNPALQGPPAPPVDPDALGEES